MNDFFKSGFALGHRLCNAAALLCALLFFSIHPISAQDATELFRGTWQIDTPDDGAIVVLLKGQGQAAYFWGDNADRTVYPGEWAADENGAKIEWQDSGSLSLKRGSTGFTATAFAADGQKRYSATARQIPQEIVGQWAKPPTKEDDMRSEREQAQGFFGIWKIGSEDPEYIFVEPDRATASTAGHDARGRRGQWAKQGSELHIIWDSGEYGILRETERGFNYQLVASGEVIEEDSSKPRSAIRTLESKVPAGWMDDYQAEREQSSGGIAFPEQKEARDFYRGDWLVRRGEETFERITLSRFGGLKTSRDRSLGGQWRLSGQDLFMRWDDGIRKIISPVGQGFVVYEYRPGRPLDGVPARVLPAAPADRAKFEKHLKDRAKVAERMREMASAAGITPDQQQESGWGRSFARWAWPFSGDETETSTDEMLSEEFEPDETADPWWWPFWSEKEDDSQSSESGEDAGDAEEENDAGAHTRTEGDSAAPDPAQPPRESATAGEEDTSPSERPDAPKRQGSARDWLWPF
ncbi:MAG: hypothetical protein ACLFS1_00130 [Opitutales bacterium]